MTITEIICYVLDGHYHGIEADSNDERDKMVVEAFHKLSTSYGSLMDSNRESVDYSDPATRFAYLYKYTVAHAEFFRQALSSPLLRSLFCDNESVRVACIGGGPGTEILGIHKFLSKNSIQLKKLSLQIYDKERGWSDNWSDIEEQADLGFQFSAKFNQCDVTDEKQWRSYQRLHEQDLLSMSFFLSEVYTQKDQATPFLEYCLESMKPGAIVVYLDNYISQVDEWFGEICKNSGLNIVMSKKCLEVRYGNDEQVSDLGSYKSRFDDHYPKIKGKVSIIIAQKPVK